MDYDPSGIEIMTIYASGSTAMAYDNDNLTTPNIKWLGIRPSDFDKHGLPSNVRVQMNWKKIKLVDKLLKEEFVICKTKWHEELTKMRETKQKAEIQALNCFVMDYLTNVYLPRKLQARDWV